jgi:hypothetical protein
MKSDNFYNTYNARHWGPKEVAKTFIWSDSYGKLIQNNHSIILGARGCGKTTLMKMLTIPALHAWVSDERAEDIKKNIPFYGIYISTDIYWNVKNQTYSEQLKPYGNFSDRISQFAVNSNVFTSLCDTFLNLIEFELEDNDENKEIELCNHLLKAWKLDFTIPKIKYIKEALIERIDKVNQLIQEVIFNYSKDDKIIVPDYFNIGFETSIEHIIPKFERIYGVEDNGKKWALCFDELEFAPKWLRDKLFTSLRSRSQFILYKLSASPILPSDIQETLLNDYGPTSGNDVQMIKMWASDDVEEFSKKIIKSIIKDDTDLKVVFGTNTIYNGTHNSYKKGSKFYNELLNLIGRDDSFKNFLINKKVNIKNPIPKTDDQKDVLHRKIKPIVYFRNAFIESNKEKIKYRGRKKAIDLYYGIEVLSKICDGNPRWLIGIISEILLKSKSKSVSKKIQYNELYNASKRFENVIANIPIGGNKITIVDLIDKIGGYFNQQILGSQFNMDPKSTFIVDVSENLIQSNLIELIEKGVYQGAFILLDSNDDSFDFQIRGRRFRLSYLFNIIYNLPIRNYGEIKLSTCLNKPEENLSEQISLFN